MMYTLFSISALEPRLLVFVLTTSIERTSQFMFQAKQNRIKQFFHREMVICLCFRTAVYRYVVGVCT